MISEFDIKNNCKFIYKFAAIILINTNSKIMIDFISTILLLVVVLAAGAISRAKNIFRPEAISTLSSFVFYIALPALFLSKVSKLEFSLIELELILGSIIPVFILVVLIAVSHAFRFINLGVFITSGLSSVFASNAFFGIAYFSSLYGPKGETFSVITASVLGIFGIVGSVSLFEYGINRKISFAVLLNVVKNPAIVAILTGVAMALGDINIGFIDKSGELLGKTAGGIAIFSLGMFIYDHFSMELIKKSLFYVTFRSFSLPLITYIVLLFLPNLSNEYKSFLFQQSGIPAAVSVAIFAQKYEFLKNEIGGIVVLSSLVGLPVLSLLYIISNMIWGV